MPRLLFEKTGNAIWISHLDLMRVFQRAFKRAGLPLTHTHGFNPRPSVSIALPLSVGISSHCELLDFALDGCDVSCQEIRDQLNQTLIAGIHVLDVYEEGRKIRDLSLLQCEIILEYDNGVPVDAIDRIRALFDRPQLLVAKKTKSGMQDQDIISMIRRIEITAINAQSIAIQSLICCQNPTLNPSQLSAAISFYLPDVAPDHFTCRRIEIYDPNENVFR